MLRIQEAREARGWTQEQLANAIGTTQQTIQRWETGAVDPQVSKILQISEALGITTSFILGMQDPIPEFPMSRDEYELLHIFDHLDERGKSMLLAAARALISD